MPAALIQSYSHLQENGWITLDCWLRKAATSREWPPFDSLAWCKWDAITFMLLTQLYAQYDEKSERGYQLQALGIEDLLVRGDLDLDASWQELKIATTMEARLCGEWREIHEEDTSRDAMQQCDQLKHAVYDAIDGYFPQYSSF